MHVTIGDWTVTDTFYVVDVANTNVVLGFQWLFSVGEHIVNYQVPEMKFKGSAGKQVVLTGMDTYPK